MKSLSKLGTSQLDFIQPRLLRVMEETCFYYHKITAKGKDRPDPPFVVFRNHCPVKGVPDGVHKKIESNGFWKGNYCLTLRG